MKGLDALNLIIKQLEKEQKPNFSSGFEFSDIHTFFNQKKLNIRFTSIPQSIFDALTKDGYRYSVSLISGMIYLEVDCKQ